MRVICFNKIVYIYKIDAYVYAVVERIKDEANIRYFNEVKIRKNAYYFIYFFYAKKNIYNIM